ncbi:MAG: DUF2292 domain-containing protein [Candidatus Levybacteria bacterium]|nr:DUF2292 domain-containing protein [Candidatus Levybacteria bacterium]
MDKTKDYSTKQISGKLLDEITDAIKSIKGWGSVEIYVQDFKVVQITERNIRKTSNGSSNNHSLKIGA